MKQCDIDCRAYEMTPTRREFPAGVPDYVDTDTRLYRIVGIVRVDDVNYYHVITRFDRESDSTDAYLTAYGWDFAMHGPQIGSVVGCNGRARHRKVMKQAGYDVHRF